jgi:alpha/beta superfamily hydrolase
VETPVALDVRGGLRLEALLALPESPKAGLVVCHPHPLYGGDMDNPVVVRVAEVAQGAGIATLRFNFRGVGASGGVHAGGEGEQDDVAAALAALAGRLSAESPIGLAGYSFGAWVAARVAAAMPALPALALLAPPLGMYDLDFLGRAPSHTLLVSGSRDQYCPVEAIERLGMRLGTRAEIIAGAEHFFFGKLFPMSEAVERWLRTWTPSI